MGGDMEVLQHEKLIIEMQSHQDCILISLKGICDVVYATTYISPLLNRVLEAATGKFCEVDFRALEYVNSSSIGAIMRFIKALDSKTRGAKIIYSNSSDWQRISFRAVKTVAKALSSITVVSE